MKAVVLVVLGLVVLAAARPSDIIDIEEDHLEHEQEGVPGTAVEGEYSWVAPDGNEYKVKYIADHLGYRVLEDDLVPQVRALDTDNAVSDDEEEDSAKLRAADDDDEEEDTAKLRAADDDDEEEDTAKLRAADDDDDEEEDTAKLRAADDDDDDEEDTAKLRAADDDSEEN